MKFFSPYWLITQALPSALRAMSILQGTQLNNLTQDTPNQLTTSHNSHTNINTTGMPVGLSTHTVVIANNTLGTKKYKNTLPSTQALLDAIQTSLDEAKQINASNNNNDTNIIDNNDILHSSHSKRSAKQNQRKYEGEHVNTQQSKVVKLNIKKGDFIGDYTPKNTPKKTIKFFTAYAEMPDGTSEQLPSISIQHYDNKYQIDTWPRKLAYTLPENYLRLRLETSSKEQPSLVFINENGDSFANSINKSLSTFALNQISQIRAPNNIQHYPVNTIFDLKFNGDAWSIFYNSSKVARFPNISLLVAALYNNNDTATETWMHVSNGMHSFTSLGDINKLKIYLNKDVAYLFYNDILLHHNNHYVIYPGETFSFNSKYVFSQKFLDDDRLTAYKDFSFNSEDVFSQKFLDKEFRLQVPVTCGNGIDVNNTILLTTIKMPDCEVLELPHIGYSKFSDNQIQVLAPINKGYLIEVSQNRSENLELIEYEGKEYLKFYDIKGTPFGPNHGDNHKSDELKELHKPYHYIKVPNSIKHYTLGTKFKAYPYIDNLGTKLLDQHSMYKIKIYYSNDTSTALAELPTKLTFCQRINIDYSTKSTYIINAYDLLTPQKYIHSQQHTTYFVLDKHNNNQYNIALKTYKVGDRDFYLESDYVGSQEYLSRVWQKYGPSGTNSIASSTKKSDATQCTTESTTAKVHTAASLPITSASTTSSVTPSITTKSTTSSTKTPDSTPVNNTEDSKVLATIETTPETVYPSITMLPENSTISNNISTIEVTNTNKTGSADTPNNDNTNYKFAFEGLIGVALVLLGTASSVYCYRKTKKHGYMQVIISQNKECQSENIHLHVKPVEKRGCIQKHKPLPPTPSEELPSTQTDNTQHPDIILKVLDHNIPSNNHGLYVPVHNGSTPNNDMSTELNEKMAFLRSQIAELPDLRYNNDQDGSYIYDVPETITSGESSTYESMNNY